MKIDDIERYFIAFGQLFTAINALLDSHEELDTVVEKNRTVSAVRFMIEELERRQTGLHDALYAEQFTELERQKFEDAKAKKSKTKGGSDD